MGDRVSASVAEQFSSGSIIYLCSVNGGGCIVPTSNGLCHQEMCKDDPKQYWIVEFEGDTPNRVSFRHSQSGQYMKATGAYRSTRIGLSNGDNRTWWIPQQGRAPGAFWLKAEEYPDAWLCNQSALPNEGSLTYVWNYAVGWSHAMNWYLRAAPGFQTSADKGRELAQQSEQMKQENGNLKLQLEEMTKKGNAGSSELAEQNQKMKEELEQMRNAQAEYNSQLEAAKTESATTANENAQLKKELEQLKMNGGSTTVAMKKREEEVSKKEQKMKTTESKLAETSSENDKLRKQIEELKAASRAGGGADQKSKGDVNTARLAQLEQENQTLKDKLESSVNSDATAELEKLRQENETLKTQMGDSKWAMSAPKTEADALVRQLNHSADSPRSGQSDADTEDLSLSQLQEQNDYLRGQLIVAKRQTCHFHHPNMQVRKMPPVEFKWK